MAIKKPEILAIGTNMRNTQIMPIAKVSPTHKGEKMDTSPQPLQLIEVKVFAPQLGAAHSVWAIRSGSSSSSGFFWLFRQAFDTRQQAAAKRAELLEGGLPEGLGREFPVPDSSSLAWLTASSTSWPEAFEVKSGGGSRFWYIVPRAARQSTLR